MFLQAHLEDIDNDHTNKESGSREGDLCLVPDFNGLCLLPSGRSHSVSVIRMHGESLRLNIAQASFSTDETMTHCGLIERGVSHVANPNHFSCLLSELSQQLVALCF